MQRDTNNPIFCRGITAFRDEHSHLVSGAASKYFPVPESNWMGEFAVNVAVAYQIGAARSDLSILSAMDIRG